MVMGMGLMNLILKKIFVEKLRVVIVLLLFVKKVVNFWLVLFWLLVNFIEVLVEWLIYLLLLNVLKEIRNLVNFVWGKLLSFLWKLVIWVCMWIFFLIILLFKELLKRLGIFNRLVFFYWEENFRMDNWLDL